MRQAGDDARVETLPQAISSLMDDLGLIYIREVDRLAKTYPGPERVNMSTIARWADNPLHRPNVAKLRPLAWALTAPPRGDAAYKQTLARLQAAAGRAPEDFTTWQFPAEIAARLSVTEGEFLEQIGRMIVNVKDTYYAMGLERGAQSRGEGDPADDDADSHDGQAS